MLEKRKRGRPRIHQPKPVPTGPQVFLTRDELAARWKCSPQTVTVKAQQFGLKKVGLNRRWLAALADVEEVERKLMGK